MEFPNNRRTLVAILGANHSGSTLLGCILGSVKDYSEAFHVGEYHAFFGSGPRAVGRYACPNEDPCPLWENINWKSDPQKAYRKVLRQVPTSTIIDSSKVPYWFEQQNEFCKENRWNVRCIIAWRDPLRLGYSQWKRRGNDLEICLEKVRFNLERLEKSLMFVERKKRDFIAVNGDDLVRNPTMITKKVCAFTGIEYFPGKERYWEFEHHHLFGSSTQIDHVRAPQNAKYLFSDTPPDFPSGAFKVLNKEFRGVLKTLRQHTISSKPENAAWANFLSRFFKKDLKAPFDARGG